MNSVSVKKIASVAAGAAMLGAAFAGAATVDPAVGNFKFFQNGAPQFKIVVGASAASSDYWNAAKLAELFGNLAYSDKAVTADTSGLSCTGGGNATSSGSCSVTGQGVTIDFSTPTGAGGQTGTVTVKTQLYDYLDVKQLTQTTTRANAASTGIIGDGVTTGGYFVSPTQNPTVAYTGPVTGLGSYNVVQSNYYYLNGKSYYDTTGKTYVGDTANVAYIVNFSDQIPYMVDTVNGTITGRPSTDPYITANRNVQIQFMGQPFVITAFPNSTTNTISVGSQAVFLQMKVGQTITLGNQTLKLVQISPIATTSATLPPAYFELYNANGTRIDYFSMNSQSSDYNQNGIDLHVSDVFVGGGDSSYATVSAYASSITLTDGQQLSFNGDSATTTLDNNDNWISNLLFTTKVVQSTAVKALSQIKLSRSTSSNKLQPGQQFNLITKPTWKQLTFVGVEQVAQDTLQIVDTGDNRYSLTPNNASGIQAAASVDVNSTWLKSGYSGAFQINGVNVQNLLIDKFNDTIYYKDPNSANYTNVGTETNNVTYFYPSTSEVGAIQVAGNASKPALTASNGSQIFNTDCANNAANAKNITSGSVVMVYGVDAAGGWTIPVNITTKAAGAVNLTFGTETGIQAYNVFVFNGTGMYPAVTNTSGIKYIDNTSAATNVVLCQSNVLFGAVPTQSISLLIREPTTDNSATLNGYYSVNLYPSDPNYLFNSTNSGILSETYAAGATGITNTAAWLTSTGAAVQQGFVDPMGGVLNAVGLSEVDILYPQKLAHAIWSFGAPSTTNTTVAGTSVTTQTLAAGMTYTLGSGYSVKVDSIAGKASCGAGGAGGALSGTATCSPSSASVVNPLDPSSDPLVVLDSQASGVGPAIVVGGPMVNSLAANTPGAGDIATAPGQSGVRVVGNSIFAYGYTAADTTDAVDSLIKWVAGQRDAVRGV